MIAYLKGYIIDKSEKYLLLAGPQVGYKVWVTTDLAAKHKLNQELELFIHTAVKEDDIRLYGFEKKEALEFFESLLSVSGIGPRIGLDILNHPIQLTQQAILNQDVAFLTQIKGLGKKTAERLILELKNKITPMAMPGQASQADIPEDAILALESLGYERHYIIKQLSKLPEEITETEEVVKFVLRN